MAEADMFLHGTGVMRSDGKHVPLDQFYVFPAPFDRTHEDCGGTFRASGTCKPMYPPINHYRCDKCGHDRWVQEGRVWEHLEGVAPSTHP